VETEESYTYWSKQAKHTETSMFTEWFQSIQLYYKTKEKKREKKGHVAGFLSKQGREKLLLA